MKPHIKNLSSLVLTLWLSTLFFSVVSEAAHRRGPHCPDDASRWSQSASWGPAGVPADGDAVEIPAGTHIGLDIDSAELAGLTIEGLAPHHDRKDFSCGVDSLDRYLRTQASQDVRRKANAVFVLVESMRIYFRDRL